MALTVGVADGRYLLRTASLPSTTSFTVTGRYYQRGTGSDVYELICALRLEANDRGLFLYGTCPISPGGRMGLYSFDGTTWYEDGSSIVASNGAWYDFALVGASSGSSGARAYVRPSGSSTTTMSAYGVSVTPDKLVFGDHPGFNEHLNGRVENIKFYSAALTQAEIESEWRRRVPVRSANLIGWYPMISSDLTTALKDLSGTADLTYVGTAPTVEDNSNTPWGASPIWIVDHPAGGAGDVTVSVPSISLTLSANAPTVVTTANKVVDVPKGTLSLTSFVPSVAVSDHKLVNVPQGSLLLFGLAPTVAATAHVTVSVPADALSLSTFVPTVTATGNVLISVPLATLSLAATAPLVLTGASQIVQVPKGTLTLAAEAPTVATTANQVVSVPKADLTLTSYEPSVVATANQKVDVPAASLELTGYAPTVSADGGTIVSVPFSSLELTLHAPTIVTPRVVSIPEAVLELVAYEPTIITPRLIDVPSTSLTLTSFAPEVHTTAVIEVPATSLTITGYAPSVDAGSGGGVASTRVTWG